MHKPVMITADSTCDLSPELLERFNIKTIPLTINLGDESFPDTPDYTTDIMYARYHKDGTLPKTSAVSYLAMLEFFTEFTEAGYEVVHVDISSELSATFNNAMLAAQELTGVYPIDSRSLSIGVGLLAMEACECRDKGMTAAEIAAHLNELTSKVNTSFVLDTLEFMWKGGRCSAVTLLGANLLKIKPELEMSNGKLDVCKKHRGALSNVYVKYTRGRLEGKTFLSNYVFLVHSGEIPDEQLDVIESVIREYAPAQEILRAQAGCTISAHCGPKTYGVIFIEA